MALGTSKLNKKTGHKYSAAVQARYEAALRGGLCTPHKPLKAKKAAKKKKAKKKPSK
jgi:hypothetical protein